MCTAGLVRKARQAYAPKAGLIWKWRRTRRLVLRPSTRAEIAHIVARLEDHCGRGFSGLGHFPVDLVEVGLYPSHARDFNLAILRDPENAGNVRQAVSVGNGISIGVVEQHGKGHPELPVESHSLFGIVLRDADQFHSLVTVVLVKTLKKRESVLTCRTRNFEEGKNKRPASKFFAQGKGFAVKGVKIKFRSRGSGRESCHVSLLRLRINCAVLWVLDDIRCRDDAKKLSGRTFVIQALPCSFMNAVSRKDLVSAQNFARKACQRQLRQAARRVPLASCIR